MPYQTSGIYETAQVTVIITRIPVVNIPGSNVDKENILHLQYYLTSTALTIWKLCQFLLQLSCEIFQSPSCTKIMSKWTHISFIISFPHQVGGDISVRDWGKVQCDITYNAFVSELEGY